MNNLKICHNYTHNRNPKYLNLQYTNNENNENTTPIQSWKNIPKKPTKVSNEQKRTLKNLEVKRNLIRELNQTEQHRIINTNKRCEYTKKLKERKNTKHTITHLSLHKLDAKENEYCMACQPKSLDDLSEKQLQRKLLRRSNVMTRKISNKLNDERRKNKLISFERNKQIIKENNLNININDEKGTILLTTELSKYDLVLFDIREKHFKDKDEKEEKYDYFLNTTQHIKHDKIERKMVEKPYSPYLRREYERYKITRNVNDVKRKILAEITPTKIMKKQKTRETEFILDETDTMDISQIMIEETNHNSTSEIVNSINDIIIVENDEEDEETDYESYDMSILSKENDNENIEVVDLIETLKFKHDISKILCDDNTDSTLIMEVDAQNPLSPITESIDDKSSDDWITKVID